MAVVCYCSNAAGRRQDSSSGLKDEFILNKCFTIRYV